MSILVSIVPSAPDIVIPAGEYATLKRWDQLDGVDAKRLNANGQDQFGYIPSYITDENGNWCGSWSVNDNYSWLTNADMLNIFNMQVTDEYTPAQKMQYLTAWGDSWGNPMRVPGGVAWSLAPAVKMIGAFYAGQKVEILERASFMVEWAGVKEITPMVRVKTFSRADFGKTHASHPEAIHIMTGVSSSNQYREKVKGTVYLPVALGPDFDFVGNFKPAQWWLMERWLV
jgi:hypothetical protein